MRFSTGLEELLKDRESILLEVGPGRTLSTLARQHPKRDLSQPVLSSLRHPKKSVDDYEFLLDALGRLWLAGAEVDWKAFSAHEQCSRLSLPTYPFQRERFWVEPGRPVSLGAAASGEEELVKKPDLADWFYVPSWRQTTSALLSPYLVGRYN